MPINERQLRYFAKVAEAGNMTKAASLLHVAQPALGIQIRQLEDLLGTPLFERHSRGVALTAAGDRLYERACVILRLIEETETELRLFGENRQETLTLGITPSIMRLVGTEIISAVRRDLPGVYLSLIEETSYVLESALERSEIDLALTYELPENPAIKRTPMLREELLLVVHPDRAPETEHLPFSQLADFELVLAHSRDPIRILVENASRDTGANVTVAYEVQSLQATQRVVMEGSAASILPFGTVAPELESGRLASRRIRDPHLYRTLYLARPANRAAFINETGIMKLMQSVVKQLSIDLEDLAQPIETGG